MGAIKHITREKFVDESLHSVFFKQCHINKFGILIPITSRNYPLCLERTVKFLISFRDTIKNVKHCGKFISFLELILGTLCLIR